MAGFVKEMIVPSSVKMVEENKTENEHYARFECEPYEKGYGHTVGNSLRRVLLSSIDGAAVIAVRINGVNHEYTTIEGIKEDVLSIIMNLKKLRIRTSSDRLTFTISEKGKKIVKASDIKITGNAEIINKNLEIATLESGASFEAEIEVARGIGYQTSEQIAQKITLPAGYIFMDALFSPVKKVNYKVENARVGQETDYDKLILEIWTDGSITPKEALDRAAALLKYSLMPFTGEENVSVSEEEAQDNEVEEILNQPIENVIEFSRRTQNCLKMANIKTIKELISRTEEDLLAVKNFGEKSLEEIKQKLAEMGLELKR